MKTDSKGEYRHTTGTEIAFGLLFLVGGCYAFSYDSIWNYVGGFVMMIFGFCLLDV